ncbi:MAG: DUF1015 family protein [Lachnospiraceae bacterium]
MAVVKPFCCVHPARGLEREIAALPYDVYSREEARRAVEGKPLSFLNIDRPETLFAPEQDMYAQEVYEAARERLQRMQEDGSFIKDESPVYYIYELTMDGRSQTGIVGCASIDDYEQQVIRRHENTRAEKEEDRIRHVDACGAQTGPIFLAYRSHGQIRKIVETVKASEPEFCFETEDHIRHAGWKVSEESVQRELELAFRQVGNVYIADGHHRTASAVKVGMKRREQFPGYSGAEEFNYFLSVLFPDDELTIMDYNRVVKDLNGLSMERFLGAVSERFDTFLLDGPEKPRKKGQIVMYLHGYWFRLTMRPEYIRQDPVEGLDVAYLQRELLGPVLGIGDPRTDKRIDFVGGIRGIEELKRRADGDMEVAFAMYPTSIEELFTVADAGLLMPPKSTWFEPKLLSGLFIHEI